MTDIAEHYTQEEARRAVQQMDLLSVALEASEDVDETNCPTCGRCGANVQAVREQEYTYYRSGPCPTRGCGGRSWPEPPEGAR